MYGVRNVVMTDTATTTGYRKSLITPNDNPNDAMMNANSPICAIENPQRMALRRDSPPRRKLKEPNTDCPIMIVSTMLNMGM